MNIRSSGTILLMGICTLSLMLLRARCRSKTQTMKPSTHSLFTLKDVADFCYENKRHKGFKNYGRRLVEQQIIEACDNNRLYIAADDIGICGVVIVSRQYAQKRLYIHHIVCVRHGFRTLMDEAFRQFPDFTIAGLRNSKLVTFNKRNLYGRFSPNSR